MCACIYITVIRRLSRGKKGIFKEQILGIFPVDINISGISGGEEEEEENENERRERSWRIEIDDKANRYNSFGITLKDV